MKFTNSSLEKLVKKLADNDFKYLTQKFRTRKKKDAYPYEYMDNFERFRIKNSFTAL